MEPVTLHDVLTTWEVDRSAQRDPFVLSPSDLGGLCQRQTAFRINGRMTTDEVEVVTAATVGSLIHAGVAIVWDEEPFTATEVPLEGGGTADVLRFDRRSAEVRDLKTLNRSKFDSWAVQDGPPRGVWLQLAAYAWKATDQMGWGAQPVNLIVDAFCRETGRCATYVRPYTEAWGEQAMGALADLERDLRGWDPLTVPTNRTGRGDWLCDSCPWLTACQGPDGRPSRTALEVEEVEVLLVEYARAREAAKEATAEQEAIRARLAGAPAGEYGGWRLAWSAPREAVDWKEVRRLLVVEHGTPLPLKVDAEGEPVLGQPTIKVERA